MTTIFDGSLGVVYPDNSVQSFAASPQIAPISASVAGNALTLTLGACSLAFRSTTLGSGAISYVVNSGTLTLTISSGSTLGTVNATAARIAVLAINNSGTMELAAVNLAGGNQLDETNLISTTAEGGAGGADSASVIYSASARTNVAYRVVGFIDITEATAGTWATAPSTIQGVGGQALAAMSSLGFGQTWQNVLGSRAAGTTYYNTTGRPIVVTINSYATTNDVFTINGSNIVAFSNGSQSIQTYIIPAGASYSCSISGTSAIVSWWELR